MDEAALIGAVAGGIVLVLGKTAEALYNRRKSMAENNLSEKKQQSELIIAANEQAVRFYKDIVEALRQDIQALRREMEEQEKRYLQTREENVRLQMQAQQQQQEIVSLKEKLKELEARVSQNGIHGTGQ